MRGHNAAGQPLVTILDSYDQVILERTAAEAAALLADDCRTKDRANDRLRALLVEIVQAWSADEHHDVPLALIEAAREALG